MDTMSHSSPSRGRNTYLDTRRSTEFCVTTRRASMYGVNEKNIVYNNLEHHLVIVQYCTHTSRGGPPPCFHPFHEIRHSDVRRTMPPCLALTSMLRVVSLRGRIVSYCRQRLHCEGLAKLIERGMLTPATQRKP